MSFSPEAPRPTEANVDQGASVKKKSSGAQVQSYRLKCLPGATFRAVVVTRKKKKRRAAGRMKGRGKLFRGPMARQATNCHAIGRAKCNARQDLRP